MREWWNQKIARTRKRTKRNGEYTFSDFMIDVLFWLPELILFPLRVIYWCIRMMGRLIAHLLDAL